MHVIGTNEITVWMGAGQSVIFSQPRGDGGAPMEECEDRLFFLLPQLFNFSVETALQVNQNSRTLLGPYYGYQLTKYSIAKA